ncbi:MAG: glycosyltransferase family 39 protein [archaeon]
MKKKIILAIILLIFCLGLFLRVHDFTEKSFWIDEAFTVKAAQQDSLPSLVNFVKEEEASPPAYFILARSLYSATQDIYSLRLISVFFGVLSIILVFFLAKELFGIRTALLSSLLTSMSAPLILYSQEARVWSFFVFTALLSSHLFFLHIKKKAHFCHYAAATLLMLYSHYFSFFVLTLHLTYLLFTDFKLVRLNLRCCAIVFLAYIPQLLFILNQLPLINDKFHNMITFRAGMPPIVASLGVFWFLLAAVGFLAFVLLTRRILLKTGKRLLGSFTKNACIASGAFLLFAVLYVLTIRYWCSTAFYVRFSLFLVPFLIIIGTYMLLNVRNKKIMIIMIIITVALHIFSTAYYFNNSIKEDWKHASDIISEQQGVRTIVINSAFAAVPLSLYLDISAYNIIAAPNVVQYDVHEEFLSDLDIPEKEFVFVLSHARYGDLYLENFMETHTINQTILLKGIKIYRFSDE